uniref:Cuticular protein hypothetical 1 n=1 Tax=Leptinotarsa decemlineata TaxID=7539 RepID=A0A3Q8HG45_LEPDE|nr:activating signal cointegrator 1 complex subunit 2 homolog [Leptinotarsa decemlineata]AYA49993.1 cuticular protein hypothetical 1 [Leptinotarsa decemlineata]
MFVKLAVIACSFAFASAAYNGPLAGGQPAALYPAGVDPKACPNFPDCTNPAVAVNQIPQEYNSAPQYQQYQAQPQYQPQQYQAQPQYQPQQYQAQPQYQPQPQQYQAPINQYNPVHAQQYAPSQKSQYAPEIQNALDRGEYIGDGDYHGEGLAEALAPGHAARQSYNPAPAYNQAPQYQARAYNPAPAPQYNQAGAHATPAQIPAGVDANACPNYPFCH